MVYGISFTYIITHSPRLMFSDVEADQPVRDT